jgi:four helix bundle protein
MKSYRELVVWKKAVVLSTLVYTVTNKYPKSEIYSIINQIRRSAVSIASNIAEGQVRGHNEFIQFLRIAYGSGAELETQLLISLNVKFISQEDYKKLTSILDEVMRMLNKLISTLTIH